MHTIRSIFFGLVLSAIVSTNFTRTETVSRELRESYAGESVEVILDAFNREVAWGLCTSIDLHGCRNLMVESEKSEDAIKKFVIELCELIDMKRYGDPVIKWFGTGGVQGYTLIQLVETSCISAHWAGDRMFLDIFSCKFYDPYHAIEFVKDFFKANDTSINIWLRA